jgi:hypothetical protein
MWLSCNETAVGTMHSLAVWNRYDRLGTGTQRKLRRRDIHTVCAGPRHAGAPGRLTIWRPFKSIFLKFVQHLVSGGGGGELLHTRKNWTPRSLCLKQPEATGATSPIYSSDVLAPLIQLCILHVQQRDAFRLNLRRRLSDPSHLASRCS